MGFFTSQGMEVQLMVCKDSKQNEQEMLGNKLFQTMQKPTTFQQERLLFLFNFPKISCSKYKGLSLKSARYLYSKCIAKTYEKRLLPNY
jgi:hypothetical protein